MSHSEGIDSAVNLEPPHSVGPPSKANNATYRPFDRQPPELLSHILTLAWLSYLEDNSSDRFRFPSAPSQVDRYFNCTVNSTPILWSYLRVTPITDIAHIQDRIHRRSGAHPLDIYLIFGDKVNQEAQEMVEKTIMQNPLRFRTITLSHQLAGTTYQGSEDFWAYLRLLSGCEPLQVIRFSINAKSWAPQPDFLPPFTSSIHSLDLHCPFSWSQMALPHTLKCLSINEGIYDLISTTHILQCLSGSFSQSLGSLSLVGIFMEDLRGIVVEPCVFSSLEFFELDFFYTWEATTLLSHILTPNLRHLSLKTISGGEFPDPLKAAWKALRFPYLHKLTIREFSASQDRVSLLISMLPDGCEVDY